MDESNYEQGLSLWANLIQESPCIQWKLLQGSSQFSQSCQLFQEIKKNQAETGGSLPYEEKAVDTILNKVQIESYKIEEEDRSSNEKMMKKQKEGILKSVESSQKNKELQQKAMNQEEEKKKEADQKNMRQIWQVDNVIQNQIFKSKNLQKSQKKNTNFIKFILSHFFDSFPNHSSFHQNSQSFQEFLALQKLTQQLSSNIANRQILNKIFVKSKSQRYFRKYVADLLKQTKFIESSILKCNYVRQPNKKQYLLCSKIFALRCRSRMLADRVETR